MKFTKRYFIAAITVLASALPSAVCGASAAESYSPVQMEYLDRGTVALPASDGGIFLSWRLLGTENYDATYDIYRDDAVIAKAVDATNYTDSSGTSTSKYTVVKNGEALSSGKTVDVWKNADNSTNPRSNPYLSIPLTPPDNFVSIDNGNTYSYSANDAAAADLDGDGEYEIILKWDPGNSFDSGKTAAHTGNVYIDAYKLDGTRLWRMDLGININAGAHFTQIAAYDFDLDGKAEIALKTAPGSLDGNGNYVSAASSLAEIQNTDNTADYRHSENGENDTSGRVLSGPEFYTVFDGETGAALDTIYYPHKRGTVSEWGDSYGNRSERYLTTAAYLDGIHPSIIVQRGYYAKTAVTAYTLNENKRLVKQADFVAESGSKYAGQGNHNSTVGDVDGDGKDEYICGSLCLGYDGTDTLAVKWCGGLGHGDALHLADYDPIHGGMEYFTVHEASPYGMTVFDADDGEVAYHANGSGDTGRGIMTNYNSNGFYQIWGAGTAYKTESGFTGYNSSGALAGNSANFRIFWDGDLHDDLMDGTGSSNTYLAIYSSLKGRVATFAATSINSTKNNPCLQADILGDYREEVVMKTSDNTELRIYTTNYPSDNKIYTLMQDRTYRMQVVGQNSAYNQPPHIGYYMSDDNNAWDYRRYADYITTIYNGETAVREKNPPSDYDQNVDVTINFVNTKGQSLRDSAVYKTVKNTEFPFPEKYLKSFYSSDGKTYYEYLSGAEDIKTSDADTQEVTLTFADSDAFVNYTVNAVDASGKLLKILKSGKALAGDDTTVEAYADYGFVSGGTSYILNDSSQGQISFKPTAENPSFNIVYINPTGGTGAGYATFTGDIPFTVTSRMTLSSSTEQTADSTDSLKLLSDGNVSTKRLAYASADVSTILANKNNFALSYDVYIDGNRMTLSLLDSSTPTAYDNSGIFRIGTTGNTSYVIDDDNYFDSCNGKWIHVTAAGDYSAATLKYSVTDTESGALIASGNKNSISGKFNYLTFISWTKSTAAYIDNISVIGYDADSQTYVTPSPVPTATPTAVPTASPTTEPTAIPTAEPTAAPTTVPTAIPTAVPTVSPSTEPTAEPTSEPSDKECVKIEAYYDTDGIMTSVNIAKINRNEITLSDNTPTHKIFYWSSINDMIPLS